jgi:hypothetical protein
MRKMKRMKIRKMLIGENEEDDDNEDINNFN